MTDGDRRDGALVLVATPIGNLGDLSPRAVATMAAAALVCAEDSRRVAKLFAHAGIAKVPVVVTNEHTELSRIPTVLATLADGGDVVLVSDAGTPGVSDPGHRLVSAVLDAGYAVSIVPGPVAAVSALVISGLPSARFVVEGFLPRSGRVRAARLLAEIGDARGRFPTAESLACLAGVAPSTRQSGKVKAVTFRWGCNKQLRDALCDFAGDSRHDNPWAADLYDRAIARGHDHPHAIRILGRAWLRIIWRTWQDRQPYEATRHGSLNRLLAAEG